jgi:hypothetical protein
LATVKGARPMFGLVIEDGSVMIVGLDLR